jgi:hypothetical protein
MFASVAKGLDETNPSHHAALGFALTEQGRCQIDISKYQEGKYSLERGKALDLTECVERILAAL